MVDRTTLIIEYLEKLYAHNTVTLTDPFMQFMAQLLEDFGDEWVKRSSVCHRWSHLNDARLVSAQLADSVLGDLAVPNPLKRWAILRRQRNLFLKRAGCTSRTVQRLLSHYIQLLDALEPVLASQSFVFGQRPTLADYGLFGPMFRHFFSDPTPARILKNRAPAVQEWIARLWNCRLDELNDKPMPVTMPAASSVCGNASMRFHQNVEVRWRNGCPRYFPCCSIRFRGSLRRRLLNCRWGRPTPFPSPPSKYPPI
ncbi:glutathione S-transferase C-terminal domain-containing protein [Limnobacter litoralis]|uniref:glutathione S-transferase C-terminal domain-containing protein n=1 Tax=Limnobacter litoralis TaxID=481366 RepID=UPI0024E0E5C9|nr:glutathione S-transferase C-terminal domain-containing protein [Limnobacter litoralis]